MPKKPNPKADKSKKQMDQSKRFIESAEELIRTGSLSPTEAGERFESALGAVLKVKNHKDDCTTG